MERGLGPTRGYLSFCLDGKVSAEDRSDEDLVEYIMQVSPTPDTDRSSVFTAIEGVMQDLNIPTPSPMGKGSKGKKKANSNSLPNGIRTGTDESLVELLSRVGKILRNGVS